MGRFENNIMGLIPKEDWLNIGFTVTRPNDPIDGLFGDEKTDNLVARWNTIAAEYQLPGIAYYHAFDTEAHTTVRVPVDTRFVEKGLIKEKINQSERMRTLLRSGVQNDQMYEYVINDALNLSDMVITRTKVAKNEVMASGKMTIKENNLELTVDYGVPAAQMAFTIDVAGDIASQLQAIADYADAHGIVLNGMLTSKKVLTSLRRNKYLQILINGNAAEGAMLKNSALYSYLSEEFGITNIVTNDLQYVAERKLDANGDIVQTTKRYYPDNKITLFATNPAGRIGAGLWGDPPEIDDFELKKDQPRPFVLCSQWFEKDPHVLWTKASSLFIPVLYSPNSLFVVSVTDSSV